MSEKRSFRRARRRARLAMLAAAALPGAASAGDYVCLWETLTSPEKVRLELAARIGEAPPEALLTRWGEQRMAAHYQRCGLSLDETALARGARYLSARARAETLAASLVWEGVSPSEAVSVLDQVAPLDDRRELAEDIMALQARAVRPAEATASAGPATYAVRGAARLIADGGPQSRRVAISVLAGEWASARILADGLDQGATPPPSPLVAAPE